MPEDNQNPTTPSTNPDATAQNSAVNTPIGSSTNPIPVSKTKKFLPAMTVFTSSKALRFIVPLLLIALLPIVVLVAQQEQENRSKASAATTVSFTPASDASKPITRPAGSTLVLNMVLEPGTNIISTLDVDVVYDHTKLELVEGGFDVNKTAFGTVLNGPTVTPGRIKATLSIGLNPTEAIQKKANVAKLTFRLLEETKGNEFTFVKLSPQTSALSLGKNDQMNENVIASRLPAVIAIKGGSPVVVTPPVTPGVTGEIIGQYVDTTGKPLKMTGQQVTIRREDVEYGRNAIASPDWVFKNLKPGNYSLVVANIQGYAVSVGVCKNTCVNETLQYDDVRRVKFPVGAGKPTYIRVQYNPAASVMPTAVGSLAPTGDACSVAVADINKDGKVGRDDYDKVLSCYGKDAKSPACKVMDINNNGTVDIVDLNCIIRRLPTPTVAPQP